MIGDDLRDYRHSREFFEMKTPHVFSWFLAIIGSVAIGFIVWASVGELDVVVKAKAMLRPMRNVSTLKNAVTGYVTEKCFAQGMKVPAGETLWKIDSAAYSTDMSNTLTRVKDIDRKREMARKVASSMSDGLNSIDPSDHEAWARASVYFSETRKLQLTHQRAFESWQSENSLPATMVSGQKLRNLEIEEQLAKAACESFAAQERIRLQEESASLDRERAEFEKHCADLRKLIADSSIRSPLAGTIEETKKFNVGDYLVAGEEVARIIPEGADRLMLELTVDNTGIAEVREGMKVMLRFKALPPSDFGRLEGNILRVPADAIQTLDASPFFLVEASLGSTFLVNRHGERVDLKPGMIGDARIIVKRKRIMRIILEALDFLS